MIEVIIILAASLFFFYQTNKLKESVDYLNLRVKSLQQREQEFNFAKEELNEEKKKIKILEKKVLDLGKVLVEETQMNHYLRRKYEPQDLEKEYRDRPLTLQDIFKPGEYNYGNK